MKAFQITLLFSAALVGIVGCLPSSTIYPTVTPVPPVTRLADNLMGIEPLWTLDEVFIMWNSHDRTLDSFMGKTCFLGDFGKRGLYKDFICLESLNGNVLWSKQTGVHSIIDMASDGIYIAYSSPGELKKFDLESGNLLWRRKLSGTGSIHLTYFDNQVQVTTSSPALWILDTNAKLINRVKEGQKIIFLSTPEATFVNLNGLQALKTSTNEVLWEHIDMQRIRQAPIFTEDKLFLRNGANFSGTAYALDRASGKILWEVPNIVGNLAYSPDQHLVYALREDGNLLSIEENTGKASIIATFSSGPFLFFDGVDPCTYQLAYDEKEHFVMVYLGDSKQLFAFQQE